jgi:hypothetical protein
MSSRHTHLYETAIEIGSSSPIEAINPSSSLSEVTTRKKGKWLFSAPVDITAFLGSAIISLLALWIGARSGVLNDDSPDWAWIPAVLLIDVAHVYATNYRVYFDKEELRRRPWLYTLVPILGLIIGITLYSEGELLFWRVLAYLAVFHFIRQQYGWVALYRARVGENSKIDRWLDTLTIYLATIYPLIHWHTHLPRKFWWFLPNDFGTVPTIFEQILRPIYWIILILYIGRSAFRWFIKGECNPGKDIVVITTAVCWYVGIVLFNSDYAFTVTNVFIHGIPYLVLTYWYAKSRRNQADRVYGLLSYGPVSFILILWSLAFIEELFWDRAVWHERSWLFGSSWNMDSYKLLLVPLLALPQLTHYILDGFIWRRRSNPELGSLVE